MINLMPVLNMFWKTFVEGNDEKRINSQTPPDSVEVVSDLQYIDDGKWQHQLDVYYPKNADKPLPVIIDIHGGGWMYGTKRINKYYNMVLASKGYTVFSINYHLVPDKDVGTQLQDCMFAFEWIKHHAKEYHGDLDELFVTGDSAGGFLAAFSTMLNNSEKLREVYSAVSPELNIRGVALTCPVCYMDTNDVVGLYTKQILGKDYKNKKYKGFVNLDEALKYSSLPPVYLITCGGDMPARKVTFKAYEALEDAGVKCKLKYLPDKKLAHVFCITDPFSAVSQEVNNDMLKYWQENK